MVAKSDLESRKRPHSRLQLLRTPNREPGIGSAKPYCEKDYEDVGALSFIYAIISANKVDKSREGKIIIPVFSGS